MPVSTSNVVAVGLQLCFMCCHKRPFIGRLIITFLRGKDVLNFFLNCTIYDNEVTKANLYSYKTISAAI